MNNILFSLSPEHQFVTSNYENIDEYCDEPIVPQSKNKNSKKKKKVSKIDDSIVSTKSRKSKKILREENKKKVEEFMKAVKENDSFRDQIVSENKEKLIDEVYKSFDVSDVKLIYEPECNDDEIVTSEVTFQEKPCDLHSNIDNFKSDDKDNTVQQVNSSDSLDGQDKNYIKSKDSSFSNSIYRTSLTDDGILTDATNESSNKLDKTLEKSKEKTDLMRNSIISLNSTVSAQDTCIQINQTLDDVCESPEINNRAIFEEPKIRNYNSSDDEGSFRFVTIKRRDTVKDNEISSQYKDQKDQIKQRKSLFYHGKPRRKVPVRCVIPIDDDFSDGTVFFKESFHIENKIDDEKITKINQRISLPIKRKSYERKSYNNSLKRELTEVEEVPSLEMSKYFLDITQEDVTSSKMTIDDMLKLMEQEKLVSFRKLFPQKVKKIGEGSFGEVYSAKNSKNQNVIYKVTPFEPDDKTKTMVNGDILKGCRELLVEYVVTNEMSKLSEMPNFCCDNFVKLYRGIVVKGMYPKILLDAWKTYERNNEIFNEDPLEYKDRVNYYMILELEDAGIELEKFDDIRRPQAYSIIFQLVHCLRIAEDVFFFEHRDLHESNILIQKIDKDANIKYKYNLNEYKLKSFGVKVKIIDYTLSRMHLRNEEYFLDLDKVNGLYDENCDPDTFQSVYLKMRKITNGDWSKFYPKNNLLWIIYHVKRLFSLKGIEDREFVNFFLKDVSEMECLEELVNNDKFINFQKKFIIE
uniref:non-specific serine/threonine protein kinase n=1 Tax=Strongyloides venezuelensis TaxID=75913 RepID=A0A0K0FVY2_STRVS